MSDDHHALLQPSAAWRWVNCNGSVPLEAGRADLSDHEQARLDGNAAHYIAAHDLRGRYGIAGNDTTPTPGVGTIAPNGVVITDEMIEGAEMYVEDVLTTLPEIQPVIETYIGIETIHSDNGGTPDCYKVKRFDDGSAVLALWDFKFGHGFVDAFENWQLIDYSAGVLEKEKLDPAKTQVVFNVIQPRNYHAIGPIRRWTVKAIDLHTYFDRLREAARGARGNDPRTVVGPWCDDCKGRHVCPALHAAADRAIDRSEGAVPLELPPAALGLELRNLIRAKETLEARITGLEAQGLAYERSGQRVPFFQVEQTIGKETWTVPSDQVFAMGDALGVDLRKAQPITPNQARKAGMDESLVKSIADRPKGALKLKPVNNTEARKVFGK